MYDSLTKNPEPIDKHTNTAHDVYLNELIVLTEIDIVYRYSIKKMISVNGFKPYDNNRCCHFKISGLFQKLVSH